MQKVHPGAAYDPRRERTWHLSIWTSPSLSAWAAQDARDGRCVAFFTGEGAELPRAAELPHYPTSVSFIAVPELSTLVPESALVSGQEPAYLELVHGPLPKGTLRDEPVDALSAHCIYLHDEVAEKTLLERFPSARPIALQALLVRAALARGAAKPVVLLHRGARTVDIVIADRGAVKLANTFRAETTTDLLYFALFAAERSGLGPDDAQLVIGGPQLKADDRALLERYFPDVAASVQGDAVVVNGMKIEAPERWLALLEQWACV